MPQPKFKQDPTHKLFDRKAQLEAQAEALSARQQAQAKKEEDRLTWLLGTLVYDRMGDVPGLRRFVEKELPARLTDRDCERGLWQVLFPIQQEGQA